MTIITDYGQVRMHAMGDTLREHRRSRPHLLAAVDGPIRLTYAELDQRVNRLTVALRARGVGQRDRLLWLGQNSVKLLELFLASAKIGALVCPANWRQSEQELNQTVRDFDPKVIFWQEQELGEQHQRLKSEWKNLSQIWIQHDGQGQDGYEALLASGGDEDNEAQIDPELPLLAIYTAAFDGTPNAALLSHSALMIQSLISAQGQAVNEGTRYLMSGPMFHLGVLMGGLATFVFGGCCVFVSRIEPEPTLRTIQDERITHAFLPQPVIDPMRKANESGRYDISSLFASQDMADWSSMIVLPAHAPLRKVGGVYGQTETTGMSVLAWMGGSASGRPAPFVQVRILDDSGKEAASGEVGEICVRGALVMNGYFQRDAENATRSRDGWHRTRDLGRRLADGSIAFIGPKTAMIKTGFENVYPGEVEACLRLHPAVGDVCVIGVPDPRWQQRVKAVVVLKHGSMTDEAALIEHCRSNIASYKKPSQVVFVGTLPRNSVGAVDRSSVDQVHGGGGYPAQLG